MNLETVQNHWRPPQRSRTADEEDCWLHLLKFNFAQTMSTQIKKENMSAVHSPPKSMKIVIKEWKLPIIFLHVPKRQIYN